MSKKEKRSKVETEAAPSKSHKYHILMPSRQGKKRLLWMREGGREKCQNRHQYQLVHRGNIRIALHRSVIWLFLYTANPKQEILFRHGSMHNFRVI